MKKYIFIAAIAAASQVSASAAGLALAFNLDDRFQMDSSAIAGVVPQSNWFNALPYNHGFNADPALGSASNLIDSDGMVTTASATWSAPTTYALISSVEFSGDQVLPLQGNPRMMFGYLDSTDSDGTSTVTFTLPSSFTTTGYDVYVYFDGDSNAAFRTSEFKLTPASGAVQSIFGKDLASNASDYESANPFIEATGIDAGSATGGNYVRFTGLNANGFTLDAIASTSSDGFQRSAINGIQVVQVPEPASATLCALGLTGLAGLRRRRPPRS